MKTANNNYANTNHGGDTSTQSSKLSTGKHNDKVCNIHDMSGNVSELSTEYSTLSSNSIYYPYVSRGGNFNDSSKFTAFRNSCSGATGNRDLIGFRPVVWIK